MRVILPAPIIVKLLNSPLPYAGAGDSNLESRGDDFYVHFSSSFLDALSAIEKDPDHSVHLKGGQRFDWKCECVLIFCPFS